MQIAGTPGPVTDATAVPVFLPRTPTERIVDRRQSNERRRSNERRQGSAFESVADWMPGSRPALSKRALIGLGLITFSFGIFFATAIYRLRPSVIVAQPAPVERIAPVPVPSVVEVQPLPTSTPEPEPEPEPVLAVASPELAAPAPAATVAVAPSPAKAKPAPAVRARPAPSVRPKRPTQPAAARVAAPKATEPDLFAPPAPASKKWVDPFAE